MKKQKGITLIALIITIIVLLILAGVTISMVIGQNGVLTQADEATLKTRESTAIEEVELAWVSADSDYWNDWANNSSVQKSDYFTVGNLNQYLEGKGVVTNLIAKEDGTYIVMYQSVSDDMMYEMKIGSDGKASTYGSGIHISQTIPGVYDANDTLLATWNELEEIYGLDIETNYTYSSYKTSGSMYYILTNNANLSSATQVVIGNNITKIGNYTFKDCTKLTAITIPNSVTYIGSSAFSNCTKLASVNISNGVIEIGSSAFEKCTSLTSIIIPDSVTTMGSNVFYGCTGLTSANIPNSLSAIPTQMFYNCTSLPSITIPDTITAVGFYSFGGCKALTSITIPDSVTKIESQAFLDCTNLKTIVIPNSVTSFGRIAFINTKWLSERRAENPLVIVNGILVDGKSCTGAVVIPDTVHTISGYAFETNHNITSVTIPNSVTNIGVSAFDYCSKLESVNIPDSVTVINTSTFECCRSLSSIDIPDSVTSIGNNAFQECDFTTVTIPASVTNIGKEAFIYCWDLATVYFEQTTEPTIGSRCFYRGSGIQTTFYFKNSTVANALKSGTHYNASCGTKSTDYDW